MVRLQMEIQEGEDDCVATQGKMMLSLQSDKPACEHCKESDAASDTL